MANAKALAQPFALAQGKKLALQRKIRAGQTRPALQPCAEASAGRKP